MMASRANIRRNKDDIPNTRESPHIVNDSPGIRHFIELDDTGEKSIIEEQFLTLNNCNGFKIAHLNCASLTKNIDEIRILLKRTNIDVLTLSETHLSDLFDDSEISCDGYSIERKDRNRAGGGVATYVREDINYIARSDFSVENLETVVIEIKRPYSRPVIIVNWYRPPNSNLAILQSFETLLERIDVLNSECIILGDMNCDLLKTDKAPYTKHLCQIMERYNFNQCITSPTRVTHNTSSIIDLIWTNERDKIGQASVIEISLSDHYLVYCTLGKTKGCKQNEHRHKVGRNMKKVDVEKLKEDVAALSWEVIQNMNSVIEAYDCFEKTLLSILDKHAPVRKKRIKKKESPWINNDVLLLIRQRNDQKKKAKQTGDSEDWKRYRELRNKVTACIRQAKKNYITRSINETNGKSGDIWKSLKCLMPQKHNSVKIPHIEIENNMIDEKIEIADCFNCHFINIGQTVQESIVTLDDHGQNDSHPVMHTVVPGDGFHFDLVNEEQVLNVIKNLKDKKACGPDNVPAEFWKIVMTYILKPLTYIINLSFEQGVVPLQWKMSRVTPVFKSGKKSDMNNYRPISILSAIAKIVEKLVFDQLYGYMDQNGIISCNQSGFRPKHSTMTSLLNVTEDWLDSLDKGNLVGVVTLDLKKAFDTVDHSILLNKLRLIGLNVMSLQWFSSYLANRMQYTCVNGVHSNSQNMQCGIPQGSNIGPLLFILFINDMPLCLKTCKISLYADDTCLYYASANHQILTESLNADLLLIDIWLKRNRLALNVPKCELLFIGTKKRLKNIIVPDVYIQNVPLKRVTHCKYLGIVIDEHLDWGKHIEYLSKKVLKDIYLLKRIRPYVTQQTALIFYKSVIQCKFDYCSAIWGNTGKGNLDSLQKLQNRTLRVVLQVEWRFPSRDLFLCLKVENLSKRRDEHVLCILYKIVHGMIYGGFRKYFVIKEYHYSLRNAHKTLELPKPQTNFKKRSLCYRGIKSWNQLPMNVKNMSFSVFKSR